MAGRTGAECRFAGNLERRHRLCTGGGWRAGGRRLEVERGHPAYVVGLTATALA
jgi:hypothetical protein